MARNWWLWWVCARSRCDYSVSVRGVFCRGDAQKPGGGKRRVQYRGTLHIHSFPLQVLVMPGSEHAGLVKTISHNACQCGQPYATQQGTFPAPQPQHTVRPRPPPPGRRMCRKRMKALLLLWLLSRERSPRSYRAINVVEEAETTQVCPGRTWKSMEERFKMSLELKYHYQVNKDRRRQSVSNVRVGGHFQVVRFLCLSWLVPWMHPDSVYLSGIKIVNVVRFETRHLLILNISR